VTGMTGVPAGLEVLVVGSGKPVTVLAHGLGGSVPRPLPTSPFSKRP